MKTLGVVLLILLAIWITAIAHAAPSTVQNNVYYVVVCPSLNLQLTDVQVSLVEPELITVTIGDGVTIYILPKAACYIQTTRSNGA